MSSSSSSSSLAECSNDGDAGNQAAVVIDAGDANNDTNNDANHGANGGSSSSSSSSSTSSGEIRRRARRRARRKAKAKAKRARRSPDRHHETNPVGYDRRKTGTHRKTGGRRRHGEGGSDLSSSTSATTGGAGMRRQRSYTDDRESYDGDAALRHGIDRRRGKASSHLPVLELLRRARESEDRTLSITGRRLTPDDVDALAAALARGTPNPIDDIEVLILSRTRLRADGCVALARALEVNTTVHTVSFFRNRIGADGAEALARLLDVNTTITTLNCGVNRIGAIGAEAIARALAGNTTLKVLELAVNKIGSLSHNVDAVAAMAEAIKHNCTLETLNLFRNGLGKRGTVLAEALAENRGSALRVLDLGACHLGTSFGRALGATLRTNRTLETISVPQNHLGEAGGAALAEALQENISVTRLDCRKNHIGAENTKSIAAALSVNVLEKAALRRSAELFATVDEICVNSLVPGGTEADVPGALVQYVDTLARLPVELRLFCARTPVRRKEPSDALIASFQRRVSLVMSDRQRDWYNAWAICALSVRVAEKVHGTLDGIPQRSPEGSRVRALLQAVHSRLTLLFIGTAFDGYIDAGARRAVATAIAAKAQAGGPAALTHPVLYGMVDAAAAKPRRAERETSNHVASVKKALAASASLSCDAAEDGTITWALRPAPPTAHPPPLSYT